MPFRMAPAKDSVCSSLSLLQMILYYRISNELAGWILPGSDASSNSYYNFETVMSIKNNSK